MTITERVNAMKFDSLTEDDFEFLKERALKSVTKHSKSTKPTKAQKEREAFLKEVADFVAEKGTVTCADIEAHFDVTNQKASRALRDAPGVVKLTDSKGKIKATFGIEGAN